MDIDWTRLIGVRERQRSAALQAVAQHRRELEAGRQQAEAAHGQWLREVQTQAAHWQATMARSAAGDLNAQQLRDAAAGSRALEARIVRASLAAARAQADASARQARLDTSRGALHAADAAVMKARQVHEQRRAGQRQAAERREEAVAEERTARAWLMNRSS